MAKGKKSVSQRIGGMPVGGKLRVKLSEYSYAYINVAVYRKRLEGIGLSSELSADHKYVTVTRNY